MRESGNKDCEFIIIMCRDEGRRKRRSEVQRERPGDIIKKISRKRKCCRRIKTW